MLKVKGQILDVNYLEELEPYRDSLKRWAERGEKLLACSPFRDERRPSFAVNLDNGTWIDSGAYEDKYKKGNFISLLSFFMDISYEEAEDYLLDKYGLILADTDSLKLDFSLTLEAEAPFIVPAAELIKYKFRHGYLGGRGISEKVQRAFKVGYDRDNKAVTLPWTDKVGNIINIKYRSVRDKRFWYMSGGQPLKNHVYGLNFIIKGGYTEAYIVEAEIDAMYLWTHGIPAIAFGGSKINEVQYKLIRNSTVERLITATDNDRAGEKFKRQIIDKFAGVMELYELNIPAEYKDVNEIPAGRMGEVIKNIDRSRLFSNWLSITA